MTAAIVKHTERAPVVAIAVLEVLQSKGMTAFGQLLRRNRNYRYLWLGQVVSEVGDHFNSIAVLSLTLHLTGSGLAVGAVMIARVAPAILAAPVAGVLLDRVDRRRIMILSDLVRCLAAAAFLLVLAHPSRWLLYLLSGVLTFASPFFTSGRSAILPAVAAPGELHTANALTQTTAWLTLSIGTMLGGVSAMQFGYKVAFLLNAASFVFSAAMVWLVRSPEGSFRPARSRAHPAFWPEFQESAWYMRREPLVLAIALAGVGWATGGGAAQMLFTLFGEVVYKRGPAGIGLIWSAAGLGLVGGGILGHRIGQRLTFGQYKSAVSICFFLHGVAYILFALAPSIWIAIAFIALSRVAMGINNVLNRTMLLSHVPDRLRGRVFTTVEMMQNVTMILSLAAAGAATDHYSVRAVATVAGVLSASVTFFWIWANAAGKLTEPQSEAMSSSIAESSAAAPSS